MRNFTRITMTMILALVIWALAPLTGWVGEACAANPADGEGENTAIHVSNLDEILQELQSCSAQTKTIVLDDDIQIDNAVGFSITNKSNVVLDLNGHKITYAYFNIGGFVFEIVGSEFSLKNGSIESKIPCFDSNGSKLKLENVHLKGLWYSISAFNSSFIEITGTNNVLEATAYYGVSYPLSMSNSFLTLSGECEFQAEGRVSSAIENINSSVQLPYEYVLTDKDGVKQNDNGFCFFAHNLFVKKNTSLPEVCKEGEHQLKKIPSVAASCTEFGVEAYNYCEKCQRHFTTDDVPSLIENSLPSFIAPLNHEWGKDAICQRDGCGQVMAELKAGVNSGLSLLPNSIGNGMTYFSFVAPVSGKFSIRSIHNAPTSAIVWDKDFNQLATGAANADKYGNFSLSCVLKEGETYYVSMLFRFPCLFDEASVLISCGDDTALLIDGETIDNSMFRTYQSLTYLRTFAEEDVDKWQAHFLPFEIPYEVWKDEYEVATPLNIREYSDENGKVTKRELEVVKVGQQALPANYPLLVRVKSAGVKSFQMDDVTFQPLSNPFGVKCNSLSYIYYFIGNYSRFSDPGVSSCFLVKDGKLKRMEDGVLTSLDGQRWYIGAYSQGGLWDGDVNENQNTFLDDSFVEMEIRLVDENGPSTAIREIHVVNSSVNGQKQANQPGVYDLNGCRQKALKKGVNIVRQADGTVRKVMVK